MSDAAALSVTGIGWLHLLGGTAVLLLPGLAAADRWMPGGSLRLVWAPLWSCTLVMLAAVALDLAVGVPITPATTFVLALAVALVVAWPRLRRTLRPATGSPVRPSPARTRPRPWLRHALVVVGLAAAVFGVALVQMLPHLPAHSTPHGGAYGEVLVRAWDGLRGGSDPYPLHVDEDAHIALAAQVAREGHAAIHDPFDGRSLSTGLVASFRGEEGFHVLLAQVSGLTGASLPTLARFLPSLWAGYTALCLWMTLRPAPGAVASAAFLGALHTTARLLGPTLLVPSVFALAWMLAVVHTGLRARGPARIASLALLVPAAFYLHILLGLVCLVAGLLCAMLQPASWGTRAGLAAVLLIPMVWLLPGGWDELVSGAAQATTYGFDTRIFLVPGPFLLALAALGSILAVAWASRPPGDRAGDATHAHRVLLALGGLMAVSMALSVATDHRSDATYARLVHATMLCGAAMAGLGLGWLADHAVALLRRSRPWSRHAPRVGAGVMAVATVLALAPPLAAHLAEPTYHVFDARSWAAVRALESAGLRANDTFLAHPWQAPIVNAVTGATPWAVLRPGSPETHGADYDEYVRTGGADPIWLAARGIRYVDSPVAPNATYVALGPDAYRIG